jgi:hypothetical protein
MTQLAQESIRSVVLHTLGELRPRRTSPTWADLKISASTWTSSLFTFSMSSWHFMESKESTFLRLTTRSYELSMGASPISGKTRQLTDY